MYLTLGEAADRADRTQATIRNWIASGKITRYRHGHRVYVHADELDAVLHPTPVAE
ncbi:helix-turn-helix domain-containing protein [Gordonia humi]|uniref:Excisionase family DNA binding protein n=1 Tax=Gordonia humi TaxID=686429 RepID=A0A840EWD8_9ACTN|nr:helix-turn-helix domain-containing protein [Gordonia humi]MBB4134648.1 excisionase family DNA binding protein [Gordonia humi]